MEKKSIKKLQKYIKKNFFYNLNVVLTHDQCIKAEVKHGYWQPYVWVSSSIPYITHDTDFVFYGHLKGSSVFTIHTEMINAFNSLWGMIYQSKYDSTEHKHPKISMTLMYWDKTDVMRCIKKRHPRLLKICTTCEYPIKKNGKLRPCKKYIKCKSLQESMIKAK